MRGSVLLRVPAALTYRELACRTVAAICKLCEGTRVRGDATGRFTNEFMSAVGEAFNNVVIHAYSNSGDGMVEMELEWSKDHVAVEMRDTGAPFDFDAVPNLDLSSPHEKGMGVYIIRSFVDHVDYRAGPPNVLVLTKRLTDSRPSSRATGTHPRRSTG